MPSVIHDGDRVGCTRTALRALDLSDGQEVDNNTLSLLAGHTALEICAVLDKAGFPVEALRTVVRDFMRKNLQ